MWSAILCADWSKDSAKRSVYAAWPSDLRVARLEPPAAGWTFDRVVSRSRELQTGARPVLATFDAPLGIPRSLWNAHWPSAASEAHGHRSKGFSDWLLSVSERRGFFEVARTVDEWSPSRPFYIVPPGKGSRRAFEARFEEAGITPLRRVDALCRAKPLFIAGGIPGSVGSSAIDIWQGIATALRSDRRGIALWPFEGTTEELGRRAETPLVVGEIYPRLAYALASSPEEAVLRRPLRVAKGRREVREQFLDGLASSSAWAARAGVALEDIDWGRESEDSFDALVTAAGLLRCLLEGTAWSSPACEDSVCEGGILGSGSLRLDLPEETFGRNSAPQAREEHMKA